MKSCIRLFMWGGPSQHETFDLKPNAPEGIRGQFQPIATNVPGIRICEHLPLLARMADRYAILRSLTHTGINHGTSAYHMLTGHIHFTPGTLRHPTPNDFPSVGCAVSRFGREPKDVPAFVALPSVLHDGDGGEVPGQGAGILGQRYAPFLVNGDPTQPNFSIDTLTLPGDVNGRRFRERINLQTALDRETERLARWSSAKASTAITNVSLLIHRQCSGPSISRPNRSRSASVTAAIISARAVCWRAPGRGGCRSSPFTGMRRTSIIAALGHAQG